MEKKIKREIGINKYSIVIPPDHLKHDSESLEWELELKRLEESVSGREVQDVFLFPQKQPCLLPKVAGLKKSLLRQKVKS